MKLIVGNLFAPTIEQAGSRSEDTEILPWVKTGLAFEANNGGFVLGSEDVPATQTRSVRDFLERAKHLGLFAYSLGNRRTTQDADNPVCRLYAQVPGEEHTLYEDRELAVTPLDRTKGLISVPDTHMHPAKTSIEHVLGWIGETPAEIDQISMFRGDIEKILWDSYRVR